ncbi:hypothetical protein [Fulvivirga lutea]|uniref:Uncharacterized protein n=1 Tax=Fulvivirga lutea TaxID=2810512 RepID=A0A974WKU4_9BACT|nr:hypothetical protein [Fulvivirga lutea]QSE99062.1 hypothetical protein JR347_08240 [Fulvivirga lutea]
MQNTIFRGTVLLTYIFSSLISCSSDDDEIDVCANVTINVESSIINNGSFIELDAKANGGDEPYTYSIDGINFQPNTNFVVTGGNNFVITAKDTNGCTGVSSPIDIKKCSTFKTEAYVEATDEGFEILVIASQGLEPYEYSIDGITFQTSNRFSVDSDVEYTLTSRDANGCNSTAKLPSLSQCANIELSAEILKTQVGYIINLEASGGTAPYTYTIDGQLFKEIGSFSVGDEGNFLAQVIDFNGCLASLNIVDQSALSISFIDDHQLLDASDIDNAKLIYDLKANIDQIAVVELNLSYANPDRTFQSDTIPIYIWNYNEFNNGELLALELSSQTIATALPSISDPGNLQYGDSLSVSFKTSLVEGAIFLQDTELTGLNQNEYIKSFDVYVGCNSDKTSVEGEYTSMITESNYGGFINSTNAEVLIKFKGPEPYRYEISDVTALAYVPFGGRAYPADIYLDECGKPIMLPANTFGGTTQVGQGSWNHETGELSLPLFESFNGLSWTVEFLKKD